MSKGSKRRPGNDKVFRDNWDEISKNKPEKPLNNSKKQKKLTNEKKEDYNPFCFIKY